MKKSRIATAVQRWMVMGMARLIDADALEDSLGISDMDIYAKESIREAPTIDAVPVVRCKDCKSWEQYNACDGTKPHRCMNHDSIFYKRTKADDFCSYGERKEA